MQTMLQTTFEPLGLEYELGMILKSSTRLSGLLNTRNLDNLQLLGQITKLLNESKYRLYLVQSNMDTGINPVDETKFLLLPMKSAGCLR